MYLQHLYPLSRHRHRHRHLVFQPFSWQPILLPWTARTASQILLKAAMPPAEVHETDHDGENEISGINSGR